MRMSNINMRFLVSMLLASLFVIPSNFAYGNSDYDSKKQDVTKKPKFEEKLPSTNIGVQGLVYCKSGSKLIPIEGALTRITCEAFDEFGFETRPLSFLSEATNTNGYFLATLIKEEVVGKTVLKECRAFLEASPLKNCSEPTDVNKGITGAVLHSYRFLHDKKLDLYTVGPFAFTSLPNGY